MLLLVVLASGVSADCGFSGPCPQDGEDRCKKKFNLSDLLLLELIALLSIFCSYALSAINLSLHSH